MGGQPAELAYPEELVAYYRAETCIFTVANSINGFAAESFSKTLGGKGTPDNVLPTHT